MKMAIIGAGKWGQAIIIGRYQNKVLTATLPLGRLQQSAHVTSYIKGVLA